LQTGKNQMSVITPLEDVCRNRLAHARTHLGYALGAVAAPFILSLAACGSSGAGAAGTSASDSDVGEISLAITTVPALVTCVEIVASGSTTITKQFPVVPGTSSVSLSLGQLPSGILAITGQAYDVSCARTAGQTPSWIADAQRASVIPGTVSTLTLTFRENNPVNATANFVGNVVSTYLNGSALAIIYDDGSLRAAGMLPSKSSSSLRNAASFGAVPGASNVAQIVATETGAACALLETGAVQCMGTNASGELGNGTTTSSTTFAAVPGMTDVVELTAGSGDICARKTDQSIWCWGHNERGQTGAGAGAAVTVPAHVADGISVVAGAFHTCSVSAAGQVFCWGANDVFQLGAGVSGDSPVPQAVIFPSQAPLVGITQLALGASHSCALQASGMIWCWGDPDEGQLGNGTIIGGRSPGLVANISDATQIATDDFSTCALSAGIVLCWGDDSRGELGDGDASMSTGRNLSPSAVPNLPESTSIVAGGESICAMTRSMTLECWGDGTSGQFGDGKKQLEFVPEPLSL
jgi:Regulator of chromosome condensation (RCC1) repeat